MRGCGERAKGRRGAKGEGRTATATATPANPDVQSLTFQF